MRQQVSKIIWGCLLFLGIAFIVNACHSGSAPFAPTTKIEPYDPFQSAFAPASPTPTLPPFPSATPTPTLPPFPSATPTPTLPPFPSATPTPTLPPFPSATPTPTLPPFPSATPTPTPLPFPSPTPTPAVGAAPQPLIDGYTYFTVSNPYIALSVSYDVSPYLAAWGVYLEVSRPNRPFENPNGYVPDRYRLSYGYGPPGRSAVPFYPAALPCAGTYYIRIVPITSNYTALSLLSNSSVLIVP